MSWLGGRDSNVFVCGASQRGEMSVPEANTRGCVADRPSGYKLHVFGNLLVFIVLAVGLPLTIGVKTP
jgi:hypothetical protein